MKNMIAPNMSLFNSFQVGSHAEPHLIDLARLLRKPLNAVRVPPGDQTVLEVLDRAVEAASEGLDEDAPRREIQLKPRKAREGGVVLGWF